MSTFPISVTVTDSAGASATAATTYTVGASRPSTFSVLRPGIEFTTNAWCYKKLAANAPLDPNSAAIVNNLVHSGIYQSADGTAPLYLSTKPLWIVSGTQATQAVTLVDNNTGAPQTGPVADTINAQFAAVPIPAGFFVEQPNDWEAAIYQPATGKLWEVWSMFQATDGTWKFSWGGYEGNIAASDGTWTPNPNPFFKPGMVASGIHWLSFVITMGDLRQQAIKHPVGIVINAWTARGDVWNRPPAWRNDGYGSQDPNFPAEGDIFRLPANIDLNQYAATQWDGVSVKSPWRLIGEAIRDYGLVVYDQGGPTMAMEDPGTYGGTWTDPATGYTHYPVIDNDPVLSNQFANVDGGGYVGARTDPTTFPFTQLQLLQTNLVNTP